MGTTKEGQQIGNQIDIELIIEILLIAMNK